jgi:nitrogen fixation NifU-like protein
MDIYAQNIMDHYRHPHNCGVLSPADASQHELNDSCGDDISVSLRLDGKKIKEIKFTGHGCAISQAGISMLSDELIGQSVTAVLAYKFADLEKLFGIKISERRYKCAMIGLQAIQHALEQTKNK